MMMYFTWYRSSMIVVFWFCDVTPRFYFWLLLNSLRQVAFLDSYFFFFWDPTDGLVIKVIISLDNNLNICKKLTIAFMIWFWITEEGTEYHFSIFNTCNSEKCSWIGWCNEEIRYHFLIFVTYNLDKMFLDLLMYCWRTEAKAAPTRGVIQYTRRC